MWIMSGFGPLDYKEGMLAKSPRLQNGYMLGCHIGYIGLVNSVAGWPHPDVKKEVEALFKHTLAEVPRATFEFVGTYLASVSMAYYDCETFSKHWEEFHKVFPLKHKMSIPGGHSGGQEVMYLLVLDKPTIPVK